MTINRLYLLIKTGIDTRFFDPSDLKFTCISVRDAVTDAIYDYFKSDFNIVDDSGNVYSLSVPSKESLYESFKSVRDISNINYAYNLYSGLMNWLNEIKLIGITEESIRWSASDDYIIGIVSNLRNIMYMDLAESKKIFAYSIAKVINLGLNSLTTKSGKQLNVYEI